jgi:uncharacterized glyoxalase superfamily protein PhnB
MPGWGVIPTIRVHDLRAVLDHYRDVLDFTIERDDPENSTVTRNEARFMVEPAGSLYSDEYNAEIRERIGGKSPNALYIEEPGDIDAYYERVCSAGARIVDPLAVRPWGQKEFTVQDGAGNWLTFWSKLSQR